MGVRGVQWSVWFDAILCIMDLAYRFLIFKYEKPIRYVFIHFWFIGFWFLTVRFFYLPNKKYS